MRRGREVQQLDLGYPDSSLALESRRAAAACSPATARRMRRSAARPDSRCDCSNSSRARTGPCSATRSRATVPPRAGLHIHAIGPRGDLVDEGGHLRDAYGLAPGDWVLVRPDGYVGAIVSSDETAALATYLRNVGLGYGEA